MLKSYKALKHYYKLASVKGYIIFFEFITFLIPSILSIISPILAANAITALTVYDFSKAIFELTLDFAIIIITSILYFIYHLISNKTTKIIVNNLQEYVYTNVKQNINVYKIHSATLNNIWSCAEFNKNFLFKTCFFIKSVILLTIIIYFKFFIGLIIIAVSFISFLLLRVTNSKIQLSDAELSNYKQNSLEFFNNIQQGTKIEGNATLEKSLKDKYFTYVNQSIKVSNKISLYYNINNNFISLILKSTVFVFTIYLVSLVKTTTLTLSLYLILTPYLTSSAENLIAFFELFPEIGIMDNALKEFESLKFKVETKESEFKEFTTFNLHFSKVSLTNSSLSNINEFDIYIPHKSLILFYGESGCGKRAILQMLLRKEKPTTGSILIDNKNIFDIVEDQYNKIIYFTNKIPYFYNMSIYENLYLVCENRNKILKTLKLFGLKTEIDKLSNKYNTIVSENLDKVLLFFLGITRAYLAGVKIIIIYEFPDNLNKNEKVILNNIIQIINQDCTILIFSHEIDSFIKFTEKFIIEDKNLKNAKKPKKI